MADAKATKQVGATKTGAGYEWIAREGDLLPKYEPSGGRFLYWNVLAKENTVRADLTADYFSAIGHLGGAVGQQIRVKTVATISGQVTTWNFTIMSITDNGDGTYAIGVGTI